MKHLIVGLLLAAVTTAHVFIVPLTPSGDIDRVKVDEHLETSCGDMGGIARLYPVMDKKGKITAAKIVIKCNFIDEGI